MSTAIAKTTETFIVGGREFTSRLIIGTGKYRSYEEMRNAHTASGAEMVTVAVRRVPLDRSSESFLDHLDPALQILPNTAGRSEEHTSELSHSQISYAVFCLKKKKKKTQ